MYMNKFEKVIRIIFYPNIWLMNKLIDWSANDYTFNKSDIVPVIYAAYALLIGIIGLIVFETIWLFFYPFLPMFLGVNIRKLK